MYSKSQHLNLITDYKVRPIRGLSTFFFFLFFFLLFIYTRLDLDPTNTAITLLFKIDPIFSDKFAKYGQLRSFFQNVHLRENDSIVSPLRDVALKLFFSDSSTKVGCQHVIFRVIKAWWTGEKSQFEKTMEISVKSYLVFCCKRWNFECCVIRRVQHCRLKVWFAIFEIELCCWKNPTLMAKSGMLFVFPNSLAQNEFAM